MTYTDPIERAIAQHMELERNAARYIKLQRIVMSAPAGLYVGKTAEEMNRTLDNLPEDTAWPAQQ